MEFAAGFCSLCVRWMIKCLFCPRRAESWEHRKHARRRAWISSSTPTEKLRNTKNSSYFTSQSFVPSVTLITCAKYSQTGFRIMHYLQSLRSIGYCNYKLISSQSIDYSKVATIFLLLFIGLRSLPVKKWKHYILVHTDFSSFIINRPHCQTSAILVHGCCYKQGLTLNAYEVCRTIGTSQTHCIRHDTFAGISHELILKTSDDDIWNEPIGHWSWSVAAHGWSELDKYALNAK